MTAPKANRSFQNAVNKFIKAAYWLGDADLPAVAGLKAAAKALDQGNASPSLLGQYRLLHKQLLEGRSPKADDDDDDLLSPGGE